MLGLQQKYQRIFYLHEKIRFFFVILFRFLESHRKVSEALQLHFSAK